MNIEYGIKIHLNGRSLFTVELPPRANEKQAEAIARKFARRFPARDGYRFAVEPVDWPPEGSGVGVIGCVARQ